MFHLQNFITEENRLNKVFGMKRDEITFPLNQQDADYLARKIDCNLSPENLSCDGELDNHEIELKAAFLHNAFRELQVYCNGYSLRLPDMHEIYA